MSKLDKINKLYHKIWKERCKNFENESPIGIIEPTPERIIVIGDLHGDWEKTIDTLKIANLIDSNNDWIGGDTVVVQIGDQIDRCRLDKGPCHLEGATIQDEASDMKILYFFTKLHNQAIKEGGAVYSLMGNHELMNVDGDMRYVSRENLLEFTTKDDVKEGMKERKIQFKPGNDIANFLACTRKMALIIGENLFVHAGIVPEIMKKYNVTNMNAILALYLFDELENKNDYNDLLKKKTSPMWNRTLAKLNQKPPEKAMKILDEIFEEKLINNLIGDKRKQKISRVFVGHTPQLDLGINNVNQKIYFLDVGVSMAFDGFDIQKKRTGKTMKTRMPQVVEIKNDEVKVLRKSS